MTERYVHLKLVHPPHDANLDGGPMKYPGRQVVLQVVDGDEVLGYLGGVMSVEQKFPLDGVTNLEIVIGAFFESIEKARWPVPGSA